jgi:S-DNA-T family DNA segregation ATPase FtsK/SpoIIIE
VEEEEKSKKRPKKEKRSLLDQIGHELRKSVAAILLVGLGIVLILAHLKKAGPVGEFFFQGLNKIFGLGYYLLPAIAFVMAGVFVIASELQWLMPVFVASLVLVVAALGLIDILAPGQGGIVGNIVGLLQNPFGYEAALVIVAVLILASLIIILNIPIKIKLPDKKKKEEATTEPVIISHEPPKIEVVKKEDKEEKKKEEEKTPLKDPGVKNKISLKNYVVPPLSLLKSGMEKPTAGDLRTNANIIKRTMESFGMAVEMGEINIGPKFTRYTLKPAEGIKLSRMTTLSQDLALALAAHPIRIEAPIPGKSLVGIEVPNKSAAVVHLGSLLAYPEFTNSGPLGTIIGRDVTGEPITVDIAKMPHFLIAGATGSGKSVAIHSFIVSLLYKNPPHLLKLILIDPKKVELSVYNGIPHLITPVVTDGKKSVGIFRWAVQEMEKRYETLLEAGARHIDGYNENHKDEPMPYLVIVVDELADLMASYGKDVETTIVRLAQMARATGIHLILSTQRPSVEVITGLIKANITARIALQVASQIDSRTILDTAGAEKLLGGGDLLYISTEYSKPKRIQGAYVSENEVEKVSDFIKINNPVVPQEKDGAPPTTLIETQLASFNNFAEENEESDDELYDEAIGAVREAQKASATLLQRRLKIGYARAARLLDIMEARGVIGPGEGAKPRDVFLERPTRPALDKEDFQ